MLLASVEYARPRSLDEALSLLAANPNARAVAVGATMAIAGASGIRLVPAEEFFLGVYLTAVGPGELLTGISVPRRQGGDGFASVTIGADGTCIANAAASVNGDVRVVLGCVAATPVVVEAPSADDEAVRKAVAGAELDPPSDIHAPAEYRRQLAGVLAARAARQAREEAA